MAQSALLVVDVQNDFCPGGALPVPHGDEVVPALNRYLKLWTHAQLPIYASRDWHPERTKHFAPYGGPWPIHCVQHSDGAAFHPGLKLPATAAIISKGMDPDEDAYSCFHGTTSEGTPLLEALARHGIRELLIGGLATDYCVRATALDACKLGFDVAVLSDAIRGVELHPGDVEQALQAMQRTGVRFVTYEELAARLATHSRADG